jgi:hypothetical protein
MREANDELIDDLTVADGAADRRQAKVGRIALDEVVFVEALEFVMPDATGHGRDVVHIGCRDHRPHRCIDIPRLELVAAMRFPQRNQLGFRHPRFLSQCRIDPTSSSAKAEDPRLPSGGEG